MPSLGILVVAYAIVFGLQNEKLPFLTKTLRQIPFVESMLQCSFCTGFHAGWMIWLLHWAMTGVCPASGWHVLPSVLAWALVSAAFCYMADAAIQFLEFRLS